MASGPTNNVPLFDALRRYIFDLTDLTKGLDRDGTVVQIKNNRRMHGANAWMLMCSIMIASLGLDLNSPAVIIGAMLISPLMSPILGVGLGVGINDFETVRTSLYHFGVAIGIALVTSTIYFLITPLGQETPEILSRTSPTLLDVMIALFGGTAGIISASRKDKSNAIPGVAIATALMPPLCVSGYGIATGNGTIAWNAFYLFFLNSFFVAMSTYFIVRLLRFPTVTHLDERSRVRKTWLMILFTLLMIVPSTFILYGVWKDARLKNNIEVFIKDHLSEYYLNVDSWNYVHTDSVNLLIVKLYAYNLDQAALEDCADALESHGIPDTRLDIVPTSEIDMNRLKAMDAKISGFERVYAQLNEAQKMQTEHDALVDSLRHMLDVMRSDTIDFGKVSRLLKAEHPDLVYCAFARAQSTDFSSYHPEQPVLIVAWPRNKPISQRNTEERRMRAAVKTYLELDSIEIIRR